MTNPSLIATGAVREKKCVLPTKCYPPQSSQAAGSTSLCVISQSLNEGPEYRALTLTGFPVITLSQILSSRVMKCHHHLLVHNYSAAAAANSLFCSFPLHCLLRASVSKMCATLTSPANISAIFLIMVFQNDCLLPFS